MANRDGHHFDAAFGFKKSAGGVVVAPHTRKSPQMREPAKQPPMGAAKVATRNDAHHSMPKGPKIGKPTTAWKDGGKVGGLENAEKGMSTSDNENAPHISDGPDNLPRKMALRNTEVAAGKKENASEEKFQKGHTAKATKTKAVALAKGGLAKSGKKQFNRTNMRKGPTVRRAAQAPAPAADTMPVGPLSQMGDDQTDMPPVIPAMKKGGKMRKSRGGAC